MGDPVETFVGWTAIGLGIILVYAGIKNKAPFKDIIEPALRTGTIAGKVKPSATPTQPTTSGGSVQNPVVPFGGATAAGSQANSAGVTA